MQTDTSLETWDPKPGTVLVVDDDADEASLARRIIGKLYPQFGARAVRSGEELISYLEGENSFSDRTEYPYPVLVLLDLKMTGLSGFDVLQWLRDHPPHNFIPVIVLTGTGEMDQAKRAYALGARSFLTKPLRGVELANAINGLQAWLELTHP